jgi:hypothetical protein
MYWLTVYKEGFMDDQHGPIAQRPEWLTAIVDVATVGEHFLTMHEPPPERVLWFCIDKEGQLVRMSAHE